MFSFTAAEASLEAPTENKFPVSSISYEQHLLLFVLFISSCRLAATTFYQVSLCVF